MKGLSKSGCANTTLLRSADLRPLKGRSPILRSHFSEGASTPPPRGTSCSPLLASSLSVKWLCNAASDKVLVMKYHPKERLDLLLRWSEAIIVHEIPLTESRDDIHFLLIN